MHSAYRRGAYSHCHFWLSMESLPSAHASWHFGREIEEGDGERVWLVVVE